MAVVTRTLGMIAAATLVVSLSAGCGSDDGGDAVATDSSATPSASEPTATATPEETTAAEPSESAAPASWSTCAEVWTDGAVLPKPYPGCSLDGVAVPAKALHCSMGALLVTYDDQFWGVPGHEISRADGKLEKDPEFRQDRDTCTA